MMKNLEVCKNCWLKGDCSDSGYSCTNSFCVKNFKLSKLYDNALISLKQRQKINWFPTDNEEDAENFKYLASVEKNIMNFVDQGGNLFIHSSVTGNGKTSWALRLVQAYFNNVWFEASIEDCRALFINVPRYLLAIKDNISQKSDYVQYIKDNVLNADIVIWDEVGTKGLTQFEHENILNLVSVRIDTGKANIYTSNLNDEELHKFVGDRLYSRIVLLSDEVELFGSDKRSLVGR